MLLFIFNLSIYFRETNSRPIACLLRVLVVQPHARSAVEGSNQVRTAIDLPFLLCTLRIVQPARHHHKNRPFAIREHVSNPIHQAHRLRRLRARPPNDTIASVPTGTLSKLLRRRAVYAPTTPSSVGLHKTNSPVEDLPLLVGK